MSGRLGPALGVGIATHSMGRAMDKAWLDADFVHR